jgi:hypothetical protein
MTVVRENNVPVLYKQRMNTSLSALEGVKNIYGTLLPWNMVTVVSE